ncbi:MAG: hypothetical protein AB1757_21390 [Acidobacteriota bacterium]
MTLEDIIQKAGETHARAEHPQIKQAAKAIFHFARAAKFAACGEGFYGEKFYKKDDALSAEIDERKKATAEFNAIRNSQEAKACPEIRNPEPPEQPPLIDNVVEICSNWNCSRDKQLTILKLWNKALELGCTEKELREVLKGFHVTSRKELTNSQADELIKFLSDTINSLLQMQKEARK